jgi:hypothetical protein
MKLIYEKYSTYIQIEMYRLFKGLPMSYLEKYITRKELLRWSLEIHTPS